MAEKQVRLQPVPCQFGAPGVIRMKCSGRKRQSRMRLFSFSIDILPFSQLVRGSVD